MSETKSAALSTTMLSAHDPNTATFEDGCHEELLSRKEVSKILKDRSTSSIERDIKNGELAAVKDKISGRVYITRSSVERYRARRLVPLRSDRAEEKKTTNQARKTEKASLADLGLESV